MNNSALGFYIVALYCSALLFGMVLGRAFMRGEISEVCEKANVVMINSVAYNCTKKELP